jgi:hypothetical protein
MAKLNWEDAAKRSKPSETKCDVGTVLPNGRIITARPKDRLAARAMKAEQRWKGKAAMDQPAPRQPHQRRPERVNRQSRC